ncbi:hypothetical protein DFH06DRAFT_1429002 [Mycena polygramma]|nr:hypothetical protein DFH06DRAFT_1429002 [Mycena polygramma]
MPPSAQKDRSHANSVHKVPQGLATQAFEAKLEKVIDDFVSVPAVQRNLLKMFQTELLDEYLESVGFPPKEPAVLVAVQSLTPDHVVEMMKDEAVDEIFERAEDEFGLQSGIYTFSGEVLEKMDPPAELFDENIHLVCLYTVPPVLSVEQHDQEFHKLVDDLFALPVVQKNLLKYELWLQNNILDNHT